MSDNHIFTREELIAHLEELKAKKDKSIRDQQYEYAAMLRDDERKFSQWLKELDDEELKSKTENNDGTN